MTEIEFIAQLIISEPMSDELRIKMLQRIIEVSKNQPIVSAPLTWPQPQPTPLIPYQAPYSPHITITPCVDLCQHEYPFPWHSITPPPCKKCGKTAQPFTVTSSGVITTLADGSSFRSN